LTSTVRAYWPVFQDQESISIWNECFEKAMYRFLHPVVFTLFKIMYRDEDRMFVDCCQKLKEMDPSDFGSQILQGTKPNIGARIAALRHYEDAIQLLQGLPRLMEPGSKLRLLEDVHKEVCTQSQAIWALSNSSKFLMSADELLPILCYIIVQANIPGTYSECQYILAFIPPEEMLGHFGYIVTTLQIAIRHILKLEDAMMDRRSRTQSLNRIELAITTAHSAAHATVSNNGVAPKQSARFSTVWNETNKSFPFEANDASQVIGSNMMVQPTVTENYVK